MARLLWALTCQRVITDRETNTASYIDAIEQVSVPGLPAVFVPQLCVASLWKRDRDGDVLRTRYRLMAPSGKEIVSFQPDPATLSTERYRMSVLFSGFPIEEVGEYNFLIDILTGEDWENVSSLPITVVLTEEASPKRSAERGSGLNRARG